MEEQLENYLSQCALENDPDQESKTSDDSFGKKKQLERFDTSKCMVMPPDYRTTPKKEQSN